MKNSLPEQVDPKAAKKKTPSFFSYRHGVALQTLLRLYQAQISKAVWFSRQAQRCRRRPGVSAHAFSSRLGVFENPSSSNGVDQKLEGVVERLIREEIKRIACSN